MSSFSSSTITHHRRSRQELFGPHPPPLNLVTDLLDILCKEKGTVTEQDLDAAGFDTTRPFWFISSFVYTRYILYCMTRRLSPFYLVQEVLPYAFKSRRTPWINKMNKENPTFHYKDFLVIVLQVIYSHQLLCFKTTTYLQSEEVSNCYIGFPKKQSSSEEEEEELSSITTTSGN